MTDRIKLGKPEQNGVTCNALIVLLDCYRGFEPKRHLGTLDADLRFLQREGLVCNTSMTGDFPWSLTLAGDLLCERLLEFAEKEVGPIVRPELDAKESR